MSDEHDVLAEILRVQDRHQRALSVAREGLEGLLKRTSWSYETKEDALGLIRGYVETYIDRINRISPKDPASS